jgi:hypothetical protein
MLMILSDTRVMNALMNERPGAMWPRGPLAIHLGRPDDRLEDLSVGHELAQLGEHVGTVGRSAGGCHHVPDADEQLELGEELPRPRSSPGP